ncbi:nucleolar protein 58-like [Palaemon carinicauda]|uniref:nucleolar protein 58-like n=1 Tax=Palaemon carinicauda TaxID=392227 RepID=UPI0035B5E81F
MASITKERDSHKERVSHLSSSKEMSEERIVQFTKENVGLKDELLAANEIIPSLKEELEGGNKKKENRPGMRKVRLNRTSLEISTEMDVKNVHKEDVQKDVRDNKTSKGALHDTNNRQEERKLQKETSTDEEKEEKEEEEKEEEENSHITFQGEKVRATTTRDYGLNGYVTVDLNVPRKFHRAIYGVEGRTQMEITCQKESA